MQGRGQSASQGGTKVTPGEIQEPGPGDAQGRDLPSVPRGLDAAGRCLCGAGGEGLVLIMAGGDTPVHVDGWRGDRSPGGLFALGLERQEQGYHQ